MEWWRSHTVDHNQNFFGLVEIFFLQLAYAKLLVLAF